MITSNTIKVIIQYVRGIVSASMLMAAVLPLSVMAHDAHTMPGDSKTTQGQAEGTNSQGALLQAIRDSTERYKDVTVAQKDGYTLQFGCVTGSDSGAMGLHYVNGNLVNSAVLDAAHPQIVIYEPLPDGTLKLIGADFLLIADAWNATHSSPPQLMGQLFHLFDAPNRFGLPAFYTLHVWAWKDNPNGAFVNWHPNVSCTSFAGENK